MNPSQSTIPAAPVFTAEEVGPLCLVTGGAGYLGSKIVQRLLDSGCRVRSLDVAPQKPRDGVEAIQADLQDKKALQKACEGVDTVFHTAALISLLSTYRAAVKDRVFGVNVEGTRHLLQAAANAGVELSCTPVHSMSHCTRITLARNKTKAALMFMATKTCTP